MKNKKKITMSMTKSNAMANWISVKFFQKFKNLEESNAVRGIFLCLYNDSNSKVLKFLEKLNNYILG